MIAWINRMRGKNEPTLEQEAEEEAIGLDRDILHRELRMIEMRHLIEAHRAKQRHLQMWLQQRISAPKAKDSVAPYDPTRDGM